MLGFFLFIQLTTLNDDGILITVKSYRNGECLVEYKEARGVCGIYKITNDVNGKVYVGQSVNIGNRWATHMAALRGNYHHNDHLQKSVNKYGLDHFKFNIIEECTEEEIDDREIYWIKSLDATSPNHGYNIAGGGKQCPTENVDEKTARYIIDSLVEGETVCAVANDIGVNHKVVERIRGKQFWANLSDGIEFPKHCSTEYLWVTKIPNCNSYRALVRVNGVDLYKKCWDSAYKAAVAREVFIREHGLTNVAKNFDDDVELVMPDERKTISKYYGITRNPEVRGWMAYVNTDRKSKYLGSYDNEMDAAIIREIYIRNHDEYSSCRRNFSDDEPLEMPKIKQKYSSKYTGVSWDKRRNVWSSSANINRKPKYIGQHDTEEEAAIAREMFIRDNDMVSPKVKRNFPDDMKLEMPKKPQRGKSKFVGVFFNKQCNRWQAGVQFMNHRYYAGQYNTEEQAAIGRENFIDEHGFSSPQLKRNDTSKISAV